MKKNKNANLKNRNLTTQTLISHFSPLNSKGFTLVELLIYMGILAFLILIMTQILSSVLEVQLESQSTSSIQQDSRFILAKLNYDINRATDITTPLLGQQGSTLQITKEGEENIYTLTNGNLTISNSSGTDTLNSIDTTISNLSFRRLGEVVGKNTIKINFTITTKVKRTQGIETKNFETTIGVR